MTIDAELVERVGRALGVWPDGDAPASSLPAERVLAVWPDGDLFLVRLRDAPGESDHTEARGDVATAIVLLLGHARGLRVDLGECSACRERGGTFVWRVSPRAFRGGRLARRVARAIRADEPGWAVSVVVWGQWTRIVLCRPCPTCTVDGEPTGRRTVTQEQAVLDATPQPGEVYRWVEDHGELGEEPRESWYPPEPGDPEARAVLHVLADRLQGAGDPLGTILAAWLRGPCGACDGQCSICDHDQGGYMPGYGCSDCMNTGHVCADPCTVCHGHGTVLGALADLVHAEAVRVAEAAELAVWESLDASACNVLITADRLPWLKMIAPGVDDKLLVSLGLIDDRGITPFGRRVAEAGRRALASAEASP